MAQLDEEGESGDIPLCGYAMVLGINVCGDTTAADRVSYRSSASRKLRHEVGKCSPAFKSENTVVFPTTTLFDWQIWG